MSICAEEEMKIFAKKYMWKYKHKNICIFYWLNIKILLYCNKWVFKNVNTPAYVMWFLCFHIRICIYNCMFLIRFLHGISCADLIIQHFQEELSWISFLPKVLSLLFLFLFPYSTTVPKRNFGRKDFIVSCERWKSTFVNFHLYFFNR